MSNPKATVKAVDKSKIDRSDADFSKRQTCEMSLVVEVECDGKTYNRKLTFVCHDEHIHHIGGPITVEDVERAILAEVDKVKSLHAVASHFETNRMNVDLVAELAKE